MNMPTKRKKKKEPRRITIKEAIEFKHKGAESYHQYVDLNTYMPKSKKKKDPSGIKGFDFIQENKRGYLNG